MRVNVELEQMWTFTPTPSDSGGIDIPDEFLTRYVEISLQFFEMNGELEELYRQHFMKK